MFFGGLFFGGGFFNGIPGVGSGNYRPKKWTLEESLAYAELLRDVFRKPEPEVVKAEVFEKKAEPVRERGLELVAQAREMMRDLQDERNIVLSMQRVERLMGRIEAQVVKYEAAVEKARLAVEQEEEEAINVILLT